MKLKSNINITEIFWLFYQNKAKTYFANYFQNNFDSSKADKKVKQNLIP